MSVAYEQKASTALQQLGLDVADKQLDQAAQQAAAAGWSYTHFLGYLRKQKRAARDQDVNDPAVSFGKETQGKATLQWERGFYKNRELKEWLEAAIYGGESPWMSLWATASKTGAGVLLVCLLFAAPRDYQRLRVRKYGRRTKGPEMVSAARFNGGHRSQGIGFITKERRSLGEFVLRREGGMVRLPRERESSHFMMMGDTGGEIFADPAILLQVEERGETAIVYDLALEYTPQFYNPGWGDVILNPVDERMPYWSPCDEVRHEAEAEGLAAALFKDVRAPILFS